MANQTRIFLAIVFFLWIAFVLAAYYAVQKPIMPWDASDITDWQAAFETAPTLAGIAGSLVSLFTTMAIGFAALLGGTRMAPLPYPDVGSTLRMRAEYWLLCTGLGFGLIGIVMLGLALSGALWPSLVMAMSVALVVLAPRRLWADFGTDLREMVAVRLPLTLRIFLLLSLATALLRALAPPTAWDALVYHLTVPQRILMAGRWLPFNDILPHEDFPMLMSSLYLLAMLMRGDIAAQCIHLLFGLMTLGLIALTTRQMSSREAVPTALAITLSIPIVMLLSSWAYSDIALTFYTLAAVYAYQRWLTERTQGYLIVAGLMAGLALGLKYTSFLLPVGIIAFLLYDGRGSRVRAIGVFTLACAVTAAPWYLKNLWFTGNPVYPLVFGGPHWDALRAVWYARPGTGIGFDPIALLTLPIVTTLGFRDANFIDGRIGPLLLLLLPLLVIRRPRIDRFIILFALYFVTWTVGVISTQSLWQARLLVPALILLVPPLAQATERLKAFELPSLSLHRITRMAIALVLGIALIPQTLEFVKFSPVAAVTGAESLDHYYLRQNGNQAAAMAAIRQLPANARVQFLWETQSYLAQRAVRADAVLDAMPHLTATTGSVAASVQQLKAEGFTHLLVWEAYVQYTNSNLHDAATERDAKELEELESGYARIVFENGAYRLLELK